METPTLPDQISSLTADFENDSLKATIQLRLMNLRLELEGYIPQKQAEVRVLQAQIQELQTKMNDLMAEANTHVANIEGAVKELERLLEQ
jgi:uncharacterized protein YlxW (UPF0749 family)